MKTTQINDKHFRDWENDTFGFGYGTGEKHTLPALKKFFNSFEDDPCGEKRSYNYEKLEKALGAETTWLLINILCKVDIIEYGTSPRYAWLTPAGEMLSRYMRSHTEDELYKTVTSIDQTYDYCFRDTCNCCDVPCNNPLFDRKFL